MTHHQSRNRSSQSLLLRLVEVVAAEVAQEVARLEEAQAEAMEVVQVGAHHRLLLRRTQIMEVAQELETQIQGQILQLMVVKPTLPTMEAIQVLEEAIQVLEEATP